MFANGTLNIVNRCCTDVDIANYYDLFAFNEESVDAFLKHAVVVHLEWKTLVRSLIRAVGVDEYEAAKIGDDGPSFGIQVCEVGGDDAFSVRHEIQFAGVGVGYLW
jgi:hypothetical protein